MAAFGAALPVLLDSHVHLSLHRSGGLANLWIASEPAAFDRDWSCQDLAAAARAAGCALCGAVFVECSNDPPSAEAQWALGLCGGKSVIRSVVAQVPCHRGAAAVRAALAPLRRADGSLPPELRAGRYVFMMMDAETETAGARGLQPVPACLRAPFLQGLEELHAQGLMWEFCCRPALAPAVAECCRRLPHVRFIIDHLAHNADTSARFGEGDAAREARLQRERREWAVAMRELGALPNVVAAKCGAVEQWGAEGADAAAMLDVAVQAFGFDRLLFESNWFVGEALGRPYDDAAQLLLQACLRAGATPRDLRSVFHDNALRVYEISPAFCKHA
jgi:predicted TIM-barrel fold metal-dependent hydrolase